MLVSCVQCDVAFADLETNLQQVEAAVATAAEQGSELVVFPECMLNGYGYNSRDEALAQAIAADSPVWQRLADACRRHGGIHLVIGFLESAAAADDSLGPLPNPSPGPRPSSNSRTRLYNASAIVGPPGIVGSYRKIHLPQLGVDRWVDRGDRPYTHHSVPLRPSGELPQPAERARVGLAICYDCSFPEAMRRLGLGGADIIALPTNWPVAAYRTAQIVPPARSMENHLYFIAANRIGQERGFQYCGLSSICGPDGVVLAAAEDDRPQILTAKIDLAAARNKRIERTPGAHVIDRFADRQPDFY